MATNLSITPALAPPPGVTSNFVDPVSHSRGLVVLCIVFTVLSFLFVTLRLYIRVVVTHSVGADDYTALIALVLIIAYAVGIVYSVPYGVGRHQWDVNIPNFIQYAKWYWITALLYTMCILFVKATLLILYLRIFKPVRGFTITCWTVFAIVTMYSVGGFFSVLFACVPPQKSWDILIKTGFCGVQINRLAWAGAILNSITDLTIFVLPLPMVWHLQLNKKQRLGVTLIFMTGMFVCAMSLVRLNFVLGFAKVEDTTWGIVAAYQWSVLEMQVGLWCACMPALHPAIRFVFVHVVSSTSALRSSQYWSRRGSSGYGRSNSSGYGKSQPRGIESSGDDTRLTESNNLELGKRGNFATGESAPPFSKESRANSNGEGPDEKGIVKKTEVGVGYTQF